jgi:hypothetical protein
MDSKCITQKLRKSFLMKQTLKKLLHHTISAKNSLCRIYFLISGFGETAEEVELHFSIMTESLDYCRKTRGWKFMVIVSSEVI